MRGRLFLNCIAALVLMTGCHSFKEKDIGTCAAIAPLVDTAAPREIYATDVSFDAVTGEIKYTLPEAGLVRIRIGVRDGGTLLRTLLDWEERGAGKHVETWDGKDSTGKVDFSKRRDIMLVLMCTSKAADPGALRPKGFRRAPRFYVTFPDATSVNGQNVPVVSGVTRVRIKLDDNDKTWLTQSRYEVAMYIDQVFFMEDEEGTNPFTYNLDSKMMNNGLHTITINLAVYDGEIGTQSVLVSVKN